MKKTVARKVVEQDVNTPSDVLGNFRPTKITWGSAGTFLYYVYERFQNKMETAAVVLDIEDADNSVDYAVLNSCLKDLESNEG